MTDGLQPVPVRVAGLPLRAVQALHSERCAEAARRCDEVFRALEGARRELVDELHRAVPDAPREVRRELLALKRRCYAGRLLAGSPSSTAQAWPGLAAACPTLNTARALEDSLTERTAALGRVLDDVETAQRASLLAHLDDPGFRRGMTLAAPVLAAAAREARRAPGRLARADRRRLDESMARYVSRAALKLSPFSTLTRVATGTAAATGLPAGWPAHNDLVERSVLRLRRHLWDQYAAALAAHPPFRDASTVVLNTSLSVLPDGRTAVLRPPRWTVVDGNVRELRHEDQALVTMHLDPAVVPALRARLAVPPVRFGDLGARWDSPSHLEDLIHAGVLLLLPPWSVDDACAGPRLVSFLETMPRTVEGDKVVERARELLAATAGFATAARPDRVLERVHELVDELWQSVADLVGLAPASGPVRNSAGHDLYEDSTWEGRLASPAPTAPLAADDALECLKTLDPILRLSALYHQDEDFLRAVTARAVRVRPGQREFGVLELFSLCRDLWQRYIEFRLRTRGAAGLPPTFDPDGEGPRHPIVGIRSAVWAALPACLHECGDRVELSRTELTNLLAAVPRRYAPKMGGCALVQATGEDRCSWVVTRLAEGTGRLSARFTAIMSSATRRWYLEALGGYAPTRTDGESVDLLGVHGDTLNVHDVHTARALVMPGDAVDLPEGRRLDLGNVSVHIEPESLTATLRDRNGVRIVPAFRGGAHTDFLPALERFLCTFGPTELEPVLPPIRSRTVDGAMVRPRLVMDSLVLRRHAWTVLVDDLRPHLARDDAAYFLALSRWRTAMGLPERVFVRESIISAAGELRGTKPQYLDFTSPVLARVLASIVRRAPGPTLTVEEVLPRPDRQENTVALELVVDAALLHH
jgi:hypothetical protein